MSSDLIKENIAFLEKPDEIEAKGGYIPGGILLWGPPGTGKTLLAEAIAGETGKPYVFVEPGAFIKMFMGVGILKVKSLYRKLSKLSLRHGGVIVFFDEADSLGSRGHMGGLGMGQPMQPSSPFCTRFMQRTLLPVSSGPKGRSRDLGCSPTRRPKPHPGAASRTESSWEEWVAVGWGRSRRSSPR